MNPFFVPPRGPMDGQNGRALKAWVAEYMPELDEELGPMLLDDVRARLNQVTGLDIASGDTIERGSAAFLAALQAQHAHPTGEDFT